MRLPKLQFIAGPAGQYLSFVTDRGVSPYIGNARSQSHIDLAIKFFARHQGNGTLIDAGAHIGTFCIPVALATGCRVYAFEAQRVISQILGGNLVLNGVGNAWVENVLLGSGDVVFVSAPCVDYTRGGNFGAYTPDESLSGYLTRKMKLAPSGEFETVRVLTIDDFEIDDVVFIKLDVEGAELDVLKGAEKTLVKNNFPPLFFESWRTANWDEKRRELFGFVENLGYTIKSDDDDHLAQHKNRVVDLT